MNTAEALKQMVEAQLKARGIRDPKVLEAFMDVDRGKFVEASFFAEAYDDHPLPIGHGQTISSRTW